MPLNPAVLTNGLKNISAATEPEAAEAWTNLIVDYLKGATGILPTGFTPAFIAAIRLILDGPTPSDPPSPSDPDPPISDGMSAPGAGLTAIPSAFTQAWVLMVATPPLFFAGATLITPPPTLGLLSADLAAAAPANLAFDGSGVPPSTGTLEGDKEAAISVIVTGAPTPPGVPGTGFHIRNQGGTYTIPPGPPIVIV